MAGVTWHILYRLCNAGMMHNWKGTPAPPACALKDHAMTYKVAAFYQFASLPDFRDLRQRLRVLCDDLGLKGSVLLAHEGINGTLAGRTGNVCEPVTCRRYPEVQRALDALAAYGQPRMSGTGACVFVGFDTEGQAHAAGTRLPRDIGQHFVARGRNRSPLADIMRAA